MAVLIPRRVTDTAHIQLEPVHTLGRDDACTSRFAGDQKLSKRHAEIRCRADGEYEIRDLGSRNGTYVNGQRVTTRTLRDGDLIYVGSLVFVFAEGLSQVTVREEESTIETRYVEQVANQKFAPVAEVRDNKLLKRDYERLRVAYLFASDLALEVDEQTLLGRVLDSTLAVLPADRAAVYLISRETSLPTLAAMKERLPSLAATHVSETILSEAASKGIAILSQDARLDERFAGSESVQNLGIRSTICVPMLLRQELLGLLYVDSLAATRAFDHKDLQLLITMAGQASLALGNARLAQSLQAAAQQRARLQRLLSPRLSERVMTGELKIERGGERREVAVLFTDIRGFTTLAEAEPPELLMTMLNEYFEILSTVLFRYDGTLDKYLGDGMMALFGAPAVDTDACLRAIRCALEMQRELHGYNENRQRRGLSAVHTGIGVCHGPAVTGLIGSEVAMQYTAIGDTVNTASRLCGAAAAGEILVAGIDPERTRAEFVLERHPLERVKGKQIPIEVFRVLAR